MIPVSEPVTPVEVIRHLAALSRELDHAVEVLHTSDLAAYEADRILDAAYARAFIAAAGSVEARKHTADLGTMQQREAADVSKAARDHAKNRLRSIERRIDVGRSFNSALRAEASLAAVGT